MVTSGRNAQYLEKKIYQSPASNASGYIIFKQQPSAGSKITLDGVDVIFGTDVTIGATLYDTIDSILGFANLPGDATYLRSGNALIINYTLKGTVGNAYTINTDVTGAVLSNITLTGGIDAASGLWSEEMGSEIYYKTDEHNIIEKLVDEGSGAYLTDTPCSKGDDIIAVSTDSVIKDTIGDIDIVNRSKYINDTAKHMHDVNQEDTNHEYTLETTDLNGWATLRFALTNPLYHNTIASVNNYIYSFGGVNENDTTYYDTIYYYAKNSGRLEAPTLSPFVLPSKTGKHCSFTAKDKIYILGGVKLTGILNDIVIVYLNEDGTIRDINKSIFSMPIPLYGFYIEIIGDKLYIFGGKTYDTDDSTEIYNSSIYITTIYADGTISANWSEHNQTPINMMSGTIIRTNTRIYYLDGLTSPSKIYSALYDENGLLSTFDYVGDMPINLKSYATLVTMDTVYLFTGTVDGVVTNEIHSAEINTNGTLGEFILLPYTLPSAISKTTLWGYGNNLYMQYHQTIYACPITNAWIDSTNDHTAMRDYNKVSLLNTNDYESLRRIFDSAEIKVDIAIGETVERCITGVDNFINLHPSKNTTNGFVTWESVTESETLKVGLEDCLVEAVTPLSFGKVPDVLQSKNELASYAFDNNLINNDIGVNAYTVNETQLSYFETPERIYANVVDGYSIKTNIGGETLKAVSGYAQLSDTTVVYITNNHSDDLSYIKIYIKDAVESIIGIDVQLRDNANDEFSYLLEHEIDLASFDNVDGEEVYFAIIFGTNGVEKITFASITDTVFTPTLDGELCSHTFYGNIELGNADTTNPLADTLISNLRFFNASIDDADIAFLKNEISTAKEIVLDTEPTNYEVCVRPYRKNLPNIVNVSETEKVITYHSQEYIKPGDALYIDNIKRNVLDVNEAIVSVNPFETFNYPYKVRNSWVSDSLEVELNSDPSDPVELGVNQYNISGGGVITFVLKNKYYMLTSTNIYVAIADEYGTLGTFVDIGPVGFNVYRGSCVVNGEKVYIMGGIGDISNKVIAATFDDEGNLGSFSEVLTLPLDSIHSFATFSYDDNIYIAGGYIDIGVDRFYDKIYKISDNMTLITELTSLPSSARFSEAFVTKSRVYLYSNRYDNTLMYSEINNDGSLGVWKTLTNRDLPNDIFWSKRVMFKNVMYTFGGYISGALYSDKIYRAYIDESGVLGNFMELATLPFSFQRGHLFVTNSYIYILNPITLEGDTRGSDLRFSIANGITRTLATPNVPETVIDATVTHEPANYQTSIELESKDVNCELLDITFDGSKFKNRYAPTNQVGRAIQRKITIVGQGTELIEPFNTELTVRE